MLGLRVKSEEEGRSRDRGVEASLKSKGQGYPSNKNLPQILRLPHPRSKKRVLLGVHKGWGANVTMIGCLTTSVFALPNKQLVPQAMN